MYDAVLNQSTRYGNQVRLLEDSGRYKERSLIHTAWTGFRNQFVYVDPKLLSLAIKAYYRGYFGE